MSSSLLNIGSRSLAASQGTLTTIAHNIANANVAGYSRQESVLATANGLYTGSGFFGRGADLVTVKRHYDQFLTSAVQTNTALAASDGARSGALAEMDGVFSGSETGIGAVLDSLFGAAGDLANRPGDASARQAFLGRASQLAQRVTAVGEQLAELGKLADSRIAQATSQVNARLSEIKALNNQISQSQAAGQSPNDLLDKRDAALQALNGLMAVNTVMAPDGGMNLFSASGAPLLVGAQQAVLTAEADPADATRLGVKLSVGPVSQWLDADATGGGSLAGLMRFRDEDLSSAMNQVGRIALVVADAFNAQQANGVDATGTPGLALFTVAGPAVQPHSANTGSGAISAAVTSTAALKSSDYRVDWDGSNYTVTRLSDGQASSFAALPATVDGVQLSASAGIAAGDSFIVKPLLSAATSLAARSLSPQQVATGYAAMPQLAAGNKGAVTTSGFQVSSQSADTALPVTITFNSPPTTYNIVGLASGNLSNVPYTPGARIPASPATYNGWSMVLDGTPQAGDVVSVSPTTSPGTDNRNALALGALADLRLVDGSTLNESYAGLVGDVGVRVQSARDAATVSGKLQDEAVSRQQNVAGVNLDEEAANLLRFQQAYQASAKIIQASQTLFEALLQAAGR